MTNNVVASGNKPKGQKAKDPLPHDFKSLYTNEFMEELLTIDQVNRLHIWITGIYIPVGFEDQKWSKMLNGASEYGISLDHFICVYT